MNWPCLLFKPFGTSVQYVKGMVAFTIVIFCNIIMDTAHLCYNLQKTIKIKTNHDNEKAAGFMCSRNAKDLYNVHIHVQCTYTT